jgi:hypothetical protein
MLKHILPSIRANQNLTSPLDPDYPMKMSNFEASFFNNRRYFVGDFIRLSFQFYMENPVFKAVEDYVIEKNKTENSKDLLIIPSWNMKISGDETNQTFCESFIG